MKIGVVIYTYNRVEDAKINMEIIHGIWRGSGLFDDIGIMHSFNGQKNWWPKKYLEDEIVMIKNPGHFRGAADLIDAGISRLHQKFPKIDYAVVLAADTWLLKPEYLAEIINTLKNNDKYLATCAWGLPERDKLNDVGIATDFFVVNTKWTTKFKMFPLKYDEFAKKYRDIILYQAGHNIMLEKLVYARFKKAIFNCYNLNNGWQEMTAQKLHLLTEREPVHSHIDTNGAWVRKFYWPEIGLVTNHDPKGKLEILSKYNKIKGEAIDKLINAKNFDYYIKQ